MKDLLKYGLIASAGQPRNLTGEAFIGLGALLAQMDFKPSKDEGGSGDSVIDSVGLGGEKKSLINTKDYFNFGSEYVDMSKLFSTSLSGKGIFAGNGKNKNDNNNNEDPPEDTDDFTKLLNITAPTIIPTKITVPNIITDTVSPTTTGIANRLKPEVLEILDRARYKNKGKDDTPLHRIAHITKSPYLRTDNVDYRQMRQATAPGYTGEIGKAAIEGYNLVIDKYNYDQAVKADYEEEIEDQMGSLNVEADFLTDQARQDYLELSMGKKKRLNEAFNSYSNGDISKLDYENVKASLVSELQSAAATRTNITNAIKDFIENKGTIDTEASDSEMLDFLMTGEKSPERISIKNIGGVDYVTGTTRGGRGFQIPTSKIANGTAGFRVVKKASLAPVISGALKNINAYTSTVKTDLGFGVSTPNPEKARDIGIASIKTNLGSNEADLRSIMAQIYGVDHTAYQNFLGSDPAANKSAMLDDAAEYLYDTQVAEKYFPMTKTTRFTTEKTGGTTAGERKIAKIKADLDKLPPLSSSTLSSYASQLDKKIYELKEDPKTGSFYINDFKNKRRINLPSDPIKAKTEIAGYAGVTGYSQARQSQDVSQYNFDL